MISGMGWEHAGSLLVVEHESDESDESDDDERPSERRLLCEQIQYRNVEC
jgi:hypothetical protein